jgi:hypothetical protein
LPKKGPDKSRIKKKYDEYFDKVNETAKALNALDDDEEDEMLRRPLFYVRPESERIEDPTENDLNDLIDEYENVKSVRS